MSALEWLRSRPRRKALASGGVVSVTWQPTNEDGCTLTVNNSTEGRYEQPVGIVEYDGVLTDEQVQQIRNSIQVFGRPRVPEMRCGDELVACGCWPRYVGECRCQQSNVSNRTTAADFRADQQ